jgi:peptide chain release factor 1
VDSERRSQIGGGDRSEKIRTYNYPQNRVTDHRVNMSSHNLPAIMDGDLDAFIDELATRDQAERLEVGEAV